MRKTFLIVIILMALFQLRFTEGLRQSVQKPDQLVDQWFIRLNQLDDWYITNDGREENDEVVDRFLQLYRPDAFHQVGPGQNQAGAVVFHGYDGIRKWTNDFSKNYVQLGYRVDFMTRSEKTIQPVYVLQAPWGGTGVSVEFTGVYTTRRDRKRFIVPGAGFFLFDEAGKIQRVRLYMLSDELQEISP